MKKLLVFLIVFCLACCHTMTVFAAATTMSLVKQGGRGAPVFQSAVFDFTVVVDNNAAGYLKTNVSTSTITAGTHAIAGFVVMSLTGHVVNGTLVTGNSENVASMWDGISGTAGPNMIGEAEAFDESFDGFYPPRPRMLNYGATVHQGAYTRVIIFVDIV